MNETQTTLYGYIFYFVLALACGFFTANKLNKMPVTTIDYITGECIKVENCDCGCDFLPEIYDVDYVVNIK